MGFILTALTTVFRIPYSTRTEGQGDILSDYRDFAKARLVAFFDGVTGVEVVDARRNYRVSAMNSNEYQVTPLDGDQYTVPENHPFKAVWVANPVLVKDSWYELYKEQRQNYVTTRAKNLSKAEPGVLFRVIRDWGRNGEVPTFYFMDGVEITFEQAEAHYKNTASRPNRYNVWQLSLSSVNAKTNEEGQKWEQKQWSYSSWQAAVTDNATGRYHKTSMTVTMIEDIQDVHGNRYYLDGKLISGEDVQAKVEALIVEAKKRLTYIVPERSYPNLKELSVRDVRSSDLLGLATHVGNLSADFMTLYDLMTDRKLQGRVAAAQSLLLQAELILRGKDDSG